MPVRLPFDPLPSQIARFTAGGPEITGENVEVNGGGGLHATTSIAAVSTVSNV